jgi:amino acid transporter
MLGLDALGSCSYGPEAALTILLPLGLLSTQVQLPIMLSIVGILGILFFSYRQTIEAYPNGGGSYTVASANLGRIPGLVAASALLVDYTLNVAVGISAGTGALVSAVPSLRGYLLPLTLAILAVIAVINLRGIKESGTAFLLPTYLFIVTLLGIVGLGVAKVIASGGQPQPVVPPAPLPEAAGVLGLWVVLKAFSNGCTAMTGVEAVSNGVPAFSEPRAAKAERTLAVIVGTLAILLVGISFLCKEYRVGATVPGSANYQSVVSQLTGAVVGRNWFYYLTMGSVLAVLALSANTSFAGFPRLCRVLADDGYLPHAFAMKGRRLVYSRGIIVLTLLAGALLLAFGGVTDRLIPLFAIGALLAFTMSQAGMVGHWRKQGGNSGAMFVNALGALATGAALCVVLVAKFTEGAWITAVLIPLIFALCILVHKHYRQVDKQIHDAKPLEPQELASPIVVVPVEDWNAITRKALQFALKLSPEVVAVRIVTDDEKSATDLEKEWNECVVAPLEAAGKKPPALITLHSPYRRFFTPLFGYISDLLDHTDRQIAVVIPELVEAAWWQYMLHNQTAMALKAALLLHGGRRVVVINVPWYLDPEEASPHKLAKEKAESESPTGT